MIFCCLKLIGITSPFFKRKYRRASNNNINKESIIIIHFNKSNYFSTDDFTLVVKRKQWHRRHHRYKVFTSTRIWRMLTLTQFPKYPYDIALRTAKTDLSTTTTSREPCSTLRLPGNHIYVQRLYLLLWKVFPDLLLISIGVL